MSRAAAVVVQPRAIVDVDDIADRIAADDLAAALRFYDAVAATYGFLGQHPLGGSGELTTLGRQTRAVSSSHRPATARARRPDPQAAWQDTAPLPTLIARG